MHASTNHFVFVYIFLQWILLACLLFSNIFQITRTEQLKRILLNDPDMMNARFHGLQHEIQAMKSELQNLKIQGLSQGTAHASIIIKVYVLTLVNL